MLPEQRVKLKNLMEGAKACFIQAFTVFIITIVTFLLYGEYAFRNASTPFLIAIFFQTLLEGLLKLCDAAVLVKISRSTVEEQDSFT